MHIAVDGAGAQRFCFLAFCIPRLSPEPRLRRSRATVGVPPAGQRFTLVTCVWHR